MQSSKGKLTPFTLGTMPPLGVNDIGSSPAGTQLADTNEVKAESGSKGNRPQLFKHQITLSLFPKEGALKLQEDTALGYVWQGTCLDTSPKHWSKKRVRERSFPDGCGHPQL